MPAALTIIRETSDEAIRMFQNAVAKGHIEPAEMNAACVYLRDYATVEAVKLDPTGATDVAPDITDRLDAVEAEWLSR